MIWLAGLLASLTIPVLFIYLRDAWVWTSCSALWLGFSGAAAGRALVRRCPSEIDWLSASLFVLPIWGAAQIAFGWTVNQGATAVEALLWTALATLFIAARSLLGDARMRQKLLSGMLAIGFTIAILSLIQYYSSAGKIYWLLPTELERVMGPFRNRNHFTAFLELVFPIALVRAVKGRSHRLEFAFVAAMIAAPAIAAGSRAGISLLAAEAIVVLAAAKLWKWTIVPLLLAVLALVPQFAERGDGNRLEIYASTLEMIRARPGVGHGLGTYELTYPAFAHFDNSLIVDHAHNDWLEWMAEAGIAVSIPLILFAAWSARWALHSLWALGVPAIFLHALIDYPLHKPPLAAWAIVMLAALAAERKSAVKSLPASTG